MEEGYRIPTKEEFVQGFEFEVVDWTVPTGMMIPRGNGQADFTPSGAPKAWKPMKVTWMHKPDEDIVTENSGITYHTKGSVLNFFAPFDVESWIQQGLVRVKIK